MYLLATALIYEAGKREALARLDVACSRTVERLEAWVDEYDRTHRKVQKCSGDIMCSSEGVRHKADCFGRVEPFSVYAKGLSGIN